MLSLSLALQTSGDRSPLRKYLITVLPALVNAFEGENNMDILISLVVAIRACMDAACHVGDAVVEPVRGEGVGA